MNDRPTNAFDVDPDDRPWFIRQVREMPARRPDSDGDVLPMAMPPRAADAPDFLPLAHAPEDEEQVFRLRGETRLRAFAVPRGALAAGVAVVVAFAAGWLVHEARLPASRTAPVVAATRVQAPAPQVATAESPAVTRPVRLHERVAPAKPVRAARPPIALAKADPKPVVRTATPQAKPERLAAAPVARTAKPRAAEPTRLAAAKPKRDVASKPERLAAAAPAARKAKPRTAESTRLAAAPPRHQAAARPERLAAAEPKHDARPERVAAAESKHATPRSERLAAAAALAEVADTGFPARDAGPLPAFAANDVAVEPMPPRKQLPRCHGYQLYRPNTVCAINGKR